MYKKMPSVCDKTPAEVSVYKSGKDKKYSRKMKIDNFEREQLS